LNALRPTTAFVGTWYVGTDRLGRPLTNPENAELSRVLRANDFVGASMVALRFAYKKTQSHGRAQDLLGRVNLRLVRLGWDPREVLLVKRMCRLVWSEFMHEVEESANARRAEEMFLLQERAEGRDDPEEVAAQRERRREEEAQEARRLQSLRALFLEAKDELNILWLDYTLKGIREPADMARESGRDVKEFYRAADRRKRHMERLLTADYEAGVKREEKT